MDARNLIPNRDDEPELKSIAVGKLYREELPVPSTIANWRSLKIPSD
jgi:hypothetical protein